MFHKTNNIAARAREIERGGGSDRGDTDTATLTDTDTAGDTRVLQTLDNGSGNGCVLCFVLFV